MCFTRAVTARHVGGYRIGETAHRDALTLPGRDAKRPPGRSQGASRWAA